MRKRYVELKDKRIKLEEQLRTIREKLNDEIGPVKLVEKVSTRGRHD